MATTRLITVKQGQYKTIQKAIFKRSHYIENPEKTSEGEYVSSFGCSPENVDAEFALAHWEYNRVSKHSRKDGVVAYQIRQAFKPGEVSPEEANKIGYELASRFLKGKHAFIVCTHVDTHHVHNHILLNAVDLSGTRKFQNFWFSGRALAKLSDLICQEHELSVITTGRLHGGQTYNRWQGENKAPSVRDQLRMAIDEALQKKPEGLDALLQMLGEMGWKVKRGKQLSFLAPGAKRYVRMDTLGEEYSEEAIRAVLSGTRKHSPRKNKLSLVINIKAKMAEGKGAGYENWAHRFNRKQMAKALAYMTHNGIDDYADLEKKVNEAVAARKATSERIMEAERRYQDLAALRKRIFDYKKYKEVFAEWRTSGWSKKYAADHEQELQLFKDTRTAFDALPDKKVPSLKQIAEEQQRLVDEKQALYSQMREEKAKERELLMVKANVDALLYHDEAYRKDKGDWMKA